MAAKRLPGFGLGHVSPGFSDKKVLMPAGFMSLFCEIKTWKGA